MLNRQPTIHPHERVIGVVHRARDGAGYRPRPVVLTLTAFDRAFLLTRLSDLSATADAVLHHPDPGQHVSPWPRERVLERLVCMVRVLRAGRDIILLSDIDRRLLADGIEHNMYFSRLADDDPRLTARAARAANALRERVQAATGRKIARVPLGAGRTRLKEDTDARWEG